MASDPVGAGWQRLMDAGRDAYISIDRDGRVLQWNARAGELFGWSPDEARGGLLATMIVPEEFQDAHLMGLRRFASSGRGNVAFQRLRLPAMHRDGSRFDVEFTILPTRGPDGLVQFHAFLRDVSVERLSAGYVSLLQRATVAANDAGSVEEAVRATLSAIRDATDIRLAHAWLPSEEQPKVLRPTGWWFPGPLDPFSSLTMTVSFEQGIGLPGRVAATGEPAWITDLDVDANFPRAPAARDAGLRSALAFPVRVGDRVMAVIELFTKRATGPNPELLEVMATVGTQLGRVFERMETMDQLRRVAEDRQALVSIVGHEIKGPLGAAHVSLQMLRDELPVDPGPAVQELAAVTDRQLDRVRRLVEALLTAQRIEVGSLLVHREPVDVAAVVDEVVRDGRFLDVDRRIEPGTWILADPDHVVQILWNLLSNAVSHGAPPIEVAADVADGQVEITVTDAGPGIPEDRRDQVFSRYARGSGSPGTGLGLWVVRGLVEANGGTVVHEPGTSGGATFRVRVPEPRLNTEASRSGSS